MRSTVPAGPPRRRSLTAFLTVCAATAASLVGVTHAEAAVAPAAAGGVVINEVDTSNWRGSTDEDGDAEDWVELYNPGTAVVDLTGYGLSNKTASPFRWVFPAGTTMHAKGYLTVWLSQKDRAVPGRPLHASFNLDNGADPLLLTASNGAATGSLVDSVTPPLIKADQSWCRTPGGVATAPFAICRQPTINAANAGPANPTMLAKPAITPASGFTPRRRP